MLLFYCVAMGAIDNIVALGTAAVIVASSIGCAANKQPETNPQQTITLESKEIPLPVLAKYKELEVKYVRGFGRGVSIRHCIKDSTNIFEIRGSGGLYAEAHYYSKDGRYIGRENFGDSIGPEAPLPKPVDIEDYECTIVNIVK